MIIDRNSTSGQRLRGALPSLRRGMPLAGALIAVTLFIAACGSSGPGVANLGATPTPTASTSSSKASSALAFSQCMRKHGIANFPDPGGNGALTISGGPGSGLDPNSAQFQAAQKACRSLLPNGGQPSAAQQQQFEQAALAFAKCMRQHGIADYPDPTFGSGGEVQQRLPSSVDPNSPQFKSAQSACQKLLPGPHPIGGGTTTNGGPPPQGSGNSGFAVSGGGS